MNDRDMLELLRDELDFIEKGGYGRSVRTPWKSKSIFRDSLTCINFAEPVKTHPCSECQLINFVAPELRNTDVPCHQIPLNESGDTIEDLAMRDKQAQLEEVVKEWLRTQINRLEAR
ncbi:MAG TPA: hypothetical protein VJ875_08330 [Pyrinomonadaceae bacterium]|nr:hypothetical protein [Pyrinomonadaceae bacterium]